MKWKINDMTGLAGLVAETRSESGLSKCAQIQSSFFGIAGDPARFSTRFWAGGATLSGARG